MSSIPVTNADIDRTITYWFESDNSLQKWFQGGPTIDAEIKDQFGTLVDSARASQLSSWANQPRGALALLVLLDQFPRNIYRGSPLSYSSDYMALDIAARSIAKGFHREVTTMQQQFFYLPFMHDESIVSQVASISLYESLIARCKPESDEQKFIKQSLHFSERHRDCILKFGRFPSRNDVLGRVSMPEELQYLKEHPSGF